VVATHGHLDHLGGAHEFDEVLLSALPSVESDWTTYRLRPVMPTRQIAEGAVIDRGI
jgi:glyoxylase-like metal-dependent hydrolase (beta-lactamase superfamily II)